ncbi:DoxX family protein [Actinomadura flavalba]|uniref:DoxX family protein n=1 Tax=Actinomadura flavalba TaxID=1120938 RepID=UPI00036B2089|nr:DoxX family membrane protein [Actinomadura flavalba]
MRPITTLARPLAAAPFIVTGLETLRNPRERAEQVEPVLKPVADRLDWLPTKDPVTLVRVEGAVSLGTGVLLLAGKASRLTSLLLAAQLVPSLATEHRYWTEDDPERRANERSHLLKNAGLLGALLLVASEPRRSAHIAALKTQLHDARVKAGAETRVLRAQTRAELKNARREAVRQVREAKRAGGRKAAKAAGAGKATQSIGKAAGKSAKSTRKAAKAARAKVSR